MPISVKDIDRAKEVLSQLEECRTYLRALRGQIEPNTNKSFKKFTICTMSFELRGISTRASLYGMVSETGIGVDRFTNDVSEIMEATLSDRERDCIEELIKLGIDEGSLVEVTAPSEAPPVKEEA